MAGKRADFVILKFFEHLGDALKDINPGTAKWMGGSSSVKEFDIDGVPSEGYILFQAYDVQAYYNKILINGKDLPNADLHRTELNYQWHTLFDYIPTGYLKKGKNTVQFAMEVGSKDNFIIDTVVVHWRESD